MMVIPTHHSNQGTFAAPLPSFQFSAFSSTNFFLLHALRGPQQSCAGILTFFCLGRINLRSFGCWKCDRVVCLRASHNPLQRQTSTLPNFSLLLLRTVVGPFRELRTYTPL